MRHNLPTDTATAAPSLPQQREPRDISPDGPWVQLMKRTDLPTTYTDPWAYRRSVDQIRGYFVELLIQLDPTDEALTAAMAAADERSERRIPAQRPAQTGALS